MALAYTEHEPRGGIERHARHVLPGHRGDSTADATGHVPHQLGIHLAVPLPDLIGREVAVVRPREANLESGTDGECGEPRVLPLQQAEAESRADRQSGADVAVPRRVDHEGRGETIAVADTDADTNAHLPEPEALSKGDVEREAQTAPEGRGVREGPVAADLERDRLRLEVVDALLELVDLRRHHIEKALRRPESRLDHLLHHLLGDELRRLLQQFADRVPVDAVDVPELLGELCQEAELVLRDHLIGGHAPDPDFFPDLGDVRGDGVEASCLGPGVEVGARLRPVVVQALLVVLVLGVAHDHHGLVALADGRLGDVTVLVAPPDRVAVDHGDPRPLRGCVGAGRGSTPSTSATCRRLGLAHLGGIGLALGNAAVGGALTVVVAAVAIGLLGRGRPGGRRPGRRAGGSGRGLGLHRALHLDGEGLAARLLRRLRLLALEQIGRGLGDRGLEVEGQDGQGGRQGQDHRTVVHHGVHLRAFHHQDVAFLVCLLSLNLWISQRRRK